MGGLEVLQVRSLDDFSWGLLPDQGEMPIRRVIESAFAEVEAGARTGIEPPFLFLLHAGDDKFRIERLALLVPARCERLLQDLPGPDAAGLLPVSPPEPLRPGEPDLLLWAVEQVDAAPDSPMESLISVIFSRFLISGRPRRHYSCTFFLPLDLRLDSELDNQADCPAYFRVRESPMVERYRVKPPRALLAEYRDRDDAIPDKDAAHAQAYEFFYTHLQQQLFEIESADRSASSGTKRAVTPIVHWRLRSTELSGLRLDLVETETDGDGIERETDVTSAVVEDVSLYEYYNGLFLLGIRVGMPDNPYLLRLNHNLWEHRREPDTQNALVREDSDWWHGLVFSSDQGFAQTQSRRTDHWLRYTKISRLLFASFLEQKAERKIARQRLRKDDELLAVRNIDDDFSKIVLHFLACFLADMPPAQLTRDRRLRQVADDRMFVHAAYALSGPPPRPDTPEIGKFERLFSYALYVDERSDGAFTADGWAYDRKYTLGLMENDVLYRWRGAGSLSGYTSASSVFMGFGSFFHAPVAAVHVPYLYAKIQVLALFFRMSLEWFDRRIGAATQRLVEEGHGTVAFRNLRGEFIELTNNYWFRHLTPQVQGEEVASRMMARQDLGGVYGLIKDEMERADEYRDSLLNNWYQDRAEQAGWVAMILAIAALTITVLDASSNILLCWLVLFVSILLSALVWYRKRKDRRTRNGEPG